LNELRFQNDDVINDIDGVLKKILDTCRNLYVEITPDLSSFSTIFIDYPQSRGIELLKSNWGCMKFFIAIFLITASFSFIGCNKQFLGPCGAALQYRRDAEKLPDGNEKAALLGRADAAQRDCVTQGNKLQEQQSREARFQR
jgi:hypothetical protein